jgi:hypothetical protein
MPEAITLIDALSGERFRKEGDTLGIYRPFDDGPGAGNCG